MRTLFALLTLLATGCASAPLQPMTYEECSNSRRCTIAGTASAVDVMHAWMARIELPDGQCITVSLPPERVSALRKIGPQPMTVTGEVWPNPKPDAELVSVKVHGRRVGVGMCADFYLFVR